MINETIIISDTNIFLDLISVNLLKEFFCLPCNFSTTDFVINEIIQTVQQKQIDIFDNLVEYGILDKKKAADLLEQLTKINMRLPKAECELRISDWRKD